MQPSGYPIQWDVLKRFWYSFMKTGQVSPVDGVEPDPAVIQSWQRCAPRTDAYSRPRRVVLRSSGLTAVLKAHASLITIAEPFIEDIYQFLEGIECAILLADGTGCILSVGGHPGAVEQVNEMGFGVGTYWSEAYMGTNAIGLALMTAMPVQVVGPEHYFQAYHPFSSTAAPIHDVNGRIVGIIGVVEPVSITTCHTLSLIMSAARALSNQFQANLYLEEANHRLSELNTILEGVSEGIVAWDSQGRINHANNKAGDLLNFSPTAVLGKRQESVLTLPAPLAEAVAKRETLRDVEASFEVDGQTVRVLASVRYIWLDGQAEPEACIVMLRPIEQVRQLVHQQVGSHATLTIEDVSSASASMRPVLRQARTAARGTAPVLLQGEGGVGKNYLARAIHNDSVRADKPFMAINCRAIPHELMIGEFLGQEEDVNSKGRPSKFELSNGGTLLLDQIESLSLEMQSALLHVIETGHVMRLGSPRPIPVDVRIIAATSADLEQLVGEGNFISHLYYRFGVFNIEIPPLRERVDDIPILAERFLARITRQYQHDVWIDDEAMAVLRRYPWPGNVRELESVLERALNQSANNVIALINLPEAVRQGRVMIDRSPQAKPVMSAAEAEREAIIRAGWACQGRVTEMARQLDIGRTTLWRKMKQWDINPDYFKE